MTEPIQPASSSGLVSRIQAVTLDVGGTLIEPWPSVGHVYASAVRAMGGPDLEAGRLTESFGRAWQTLRPFDYSREAWRRVVEVSLAGVPAAAGYALSPECFAAIYDEFGRASAWRIYEDAEPVLAGLRARGLKIGLVSNWDERLGPLLEDLGLSERVSVVVSSREAGFAKPAPEIFQQAAQRLGVAPDKILHVGDSRVEDWQGARAAGLQARWLRRTVPEPRRAGEIRSLSEILDEMASAD